MKIKHHDIVIPKDNPFLNCKLDRKKYADILTDIVDTYADGFVLAIDNKWGTGKTTFVKMWKQQMANQDFKTLYFNAWENDFDDKPLPAILSELKSLIGKGQKEKIFKDVVAKASIFADKALPTAIKIVAKQLGADELSQDILKGGTEGLTAILNSEIDGYAKKKEGLIEFREKLEEYVTTNKGDKPVVFIIDELDRCRPNYAVQVLEQIKHFFSVPGIVFVLSIDKIQLGHAICGVYGSEKIDVDEYLRRFIDVEYKLAEPNTQKFIAYLYEYFDFKSFISSEKRSKISPFVHDQNSIINLSEYLFNLIPLSLRQIEKIYSYTRIVLNSFASNEYIFPELSIVLIYIRLAKPEIFNKIQKGDLSLEELVEEFAKFMPNITMKEKNDKLIWIEARLVFMYNKLLPFKKQRDIITRKANSNEFVCYINSRMDTNQDNALFARVIDNFNNTHETNDVSLDFLLNKISLLEGFNK